MALFKERLKELRLEKGLTQEQLAQKMDIPAASIRRLEVSESIPRKERLIALSNFFNVSIDYLIGKSDKRDGKTQTEDIEGLLNHPLHGAFFKGYLEAPEQKKAEMRQFLEFILQQEKDRKPGQKQGE
ncbi:helix-turn-helix transcriptional regulator [Paenibacillus sp. FSL R5-0527]|uniref:Helix-turn-helix family protein n=1 Tax=Paenibacillus macerans TaxID=44252 RepID=A0A090Y2E7_PAEMA|nr:helix-turn-helix transcriptional regulator [Paenibacillus macerans]KFM92918.1 helix-turn-helix family protein [Paenibacillus macerans]MCY7561591.1 helix-turn-helix domain-containing protein [Paenibacillus macerans]MEC0153310.1 helix-turn-helix transcriptional regulator [Paenibacillus macerans]OMG48332.1 transcriptional regulator [Paenibacillus macerans]